MPDPEEKRLSGYRGYVGAFGEPGGLFDTSRLAVEGDPTQQWKLAPQVVNAIIAKTQAKLSVAQYIKLHDEVEKALAGGESPARLVDFTSDLDSLADALGIESSKLKTAATPEDATAWAAGLIKLPNGNFFDQTTKTLFGPNGDILEKGDAASQEAARAAASANYAQAGLYQAQAEILRRKHELAGTPVPGQRGFIYDANGNPVDASITDAEKEQNKAAQAQLLHEDRMAELGITKEYNQGRLANEQEGNRLRGVETEQQGRYQQGQLANEMARLSQEGAYQEGQLGLGTKRLALDTAAQAADAAAKAQQNALAKQQYIGKVLSSPSDFIARAFGQRGVASPQAAITQADLINQINQEYAANPTTFAAPGQTSGADLVKVPKAYAEGTPAPSATAQVDPETKRLQSRVDSLGKLLQYVDSSDTQHRLVDELAEAKQRLAPNGAEHGMVNDKAAIVGDPQMPGVPNPEMVVNPTGAPMAVVPMNKMGGGRLSAYAFGTPYTKPSSSTQYAGGFSWDPNGTGGIKAYTPPAPVGTTTNSFAPALPRLRTQAGYQDYVGRLESIYGRGDPLARQQGQDPIFREIDRLATLPGADDVVGGGNRLNTPAATVAPAPITQEQIIAQAEANLPPAIRQLFGSQVGQKPMSTTGGTLNPQNPSGVDPLKFGFNLLSPQMLNQLTQAELEALNSYLGVKYNTSLDDVSTGIQQTFGRQQGRAGRLRL